MRYERSSRIARHFVFRKFRPVSVKGDFFNISNDVGRVKGFDVFVFAVSDTPIALAPKRWFLRENGGLSYFDNFCPTAWLGPVVFILNGGVAHQTSLRSRSIRMCYANSPPCGEAGSLFSHSVTAVAGPLLKAGIPTWASPSCRSFPRRQNSSYSIWSRSMIHSRIPSLRAAATL